MTRTSEAPKRKAYAESHTTSINGACRAKCCGGNECVCRAEIMHKLHICKDVLCRCHSREHYDEMARVK